MTAPRRVLYVEDNEQNRRLVERVVTRAGWEFLAAENGQRALQVLAAEPLPDIVLMDLAMPVMDGYEATARIRRNPRLHWLPIIAITAHAMVDDEDRAREVGCDGYLTKPFDVRCFLSTLEEHLSRLAPEENARRLDGVIHVLESLAEGEDPNRSLLEDAVTAAEALVTRLPVL